MELIIIDTDILIDLGRDEKATIQCNDTYCNPSMLTSPQQQTNPKQ